MNKKVINLQAFTSKLMRYKNTLEEMNALTEEEISRVSSLGIDIIHDGSALERQTAIFMHYQVAVFLKELGELVNELPTYDLSGDTFLTMEINLLQQKALVRFKELIETPNPELLKRFEK